MIQSYIGACRWLLISAKWFLYCGRHNPKVCSRAGPNNWFSHTPCLCELRSLRFWHLHQTGNKRNKQGHAIIVMSIRFPLLSFYCRICSVDMKETFCLCSINKYTMRLQIIRLHYSDVIMGTMASQITSLTIVFSTVYSGADQRKHQSSGVGNSPVTGAFPHKWSVTQKMFPFDDVIIYTQTPGFSFSNID